MDILNNLPGFLEALSQNSHRTLGYFMVGAFLVAVIVFAVLATVFIFHWRKYGDGGKTIKLAEWLFLAGGIAIIFLMAFSLISFAF